MPDWQDLWSRSRLACPYDGQAAQHDPAGIVQGRRDTTTSCQTGKPGLSNRRRTYKQNCMRLWGCRNSSRSTSLLRSAAWGGYPLVDVTPWRTRGLRCVSNDRSSGIVPICPFLRFCMPRLASATTLLPCTRTAPGTSADTRHQHQDAGQRQDAGDSGKDAPQAPAPGRWPRPLPLHQDAL